MTTRDLAITIETDYSSMKIMFGGVLHLRTSWPLFAIQGWKDADRKYTIEFVGLTGATIKTDYDEFEKFKTIMTLLGQTEFN